ncbi:hypothetical protein [Brumimicrobium aurantiacum]|uniref:Outer membrane protein beta-barrel domain-containing protein n=1 Tax=Brumimicrobium aurantiacum TaxID=1737063 RepID=A0A3E1F017_9FLAO|nr:hypothetical protein [Brumimicrobium aurantiacum]RFC55169.1 hypothetical protein DXU93_04940 [Brumimicrobium aurantiacum]
MKKIILTGCLAVSALFAGSANAQTFADVEKPTDATPFSIETTLGGTYGNGMNWTAPALRGRYFLDNNIAVRLQVGLGDGMGSAMSTTERYYENADGSGGEGTLEFNRMAVNLQLGGEYHFVGTQKLDPYAYLGVNFGFGNQKIVATELDPTDTYNADYSYESSGSYSNIGGVLGLGMDFYFVENVYIGAELGLGVTGFTYQDQERTDNFVVGGTQQTVENKVAGYKESFIGTQGMLRLGWRF